jgi:ribosome-associated protein
MDRKLKHTGPVKELSSLEVVEQVLEGCQTAKGQDVVVLDMNEVFDMTDYFIIVSGRSDRQAQGICNKVLARLAEQGVQPETVEGFDDGHWILVDLGDVILHIFYGPLREHYDLEGLWLKARKLVPQESDKGHFELKAA